MKKKYLIGIIIVVVIAVGGGAYFVSKASSKKTTTEPTSQSISKTETTNNTQNTSTSISKTNIKPTFTDQEQKNYYKLSQNVGDIGMPSASMTANLDQSKVINGTTYYKTYSYNTRAAYQNDSSTPTNNNYSHLISSKIISLDNKTIDSNEFGQINSSSMSNSEIQNQVAKIAALYVEGYTANDPNLEPSENSNYESNLNESPEITVDLNNTKTMNNETLYAVSVSINDKTIPMYVGLDGYIYISNENYYNDLFFPNKAN